MSLCATSLTACDSTEPPVETTSIETEPPEPEMMKPQPYPNALSVGAYNQLTPSEKEIYENIARILSSPAPGKVFELKKSPKTATFSMIMDIYRGNFGVFDPVLDNIKYTEENSIITSIKLDDQFDIDSFNEEYSKVNKVCDDIIGQLPESTSEKEIICHFLDVLTSFNYIDESEETSVYSTLVEHNGDSEGYAKAFDMLCKKAGITCITTYRYEENSYYDMETNTYRTDFSIPEPIQYANVVKIDKSYYSMNIPLIFYIWKDNIENYYNLGNVLDGSGYGYYYRRNEDSPMLLPMVESWKNLTITYDSAEDAKKALSKLDLAYDYSFSGEYPFCFRFKNEAEASKFCELEVSTIKDVNGNELYIITQFETHTNIVYFFTRSVSTLSPSTGPNNTREVIIAPRWYRDPAYSVQEEISDMFISCNVPNTWIQWDENQYIRYDVEGVSTLSFSLTSLIKVPADFIFDEQLLSKIGYYEFTADKITAKMGKNAKGVEYASYLERINDSINGHVYFRLNDEYIACFYFNDTLENYNFIKSCIDSIQLQ